MEFNIWIVSRCCLLYTSKDFLWGGAVTAHQSEGGYTEGGKIPAVCDLTSTGELSDFKEGIDAYLSLIHI